MFHRIKKSPVQEFHSPSCNCVIWFSYISLPQYISITFKLKVKVKHHLLAVATKEIKEAVNSFSGYCLTTCKKLLASEKSIAGKRVVYSLTLLLLSHQ